MANYTDKDQEMTGYIKYLEDKVATAELQSGYISKAGPIEQQAGDLAAQLVKLQAEFAKVSQENENLRVTLRNLQDQAGRAYHALGMKLDGKW